MPGADSASRVSGTCRAHQAVHHRERQVDQEDPAPRAVVDERAADERADGRDTEARPDQAPMAGPRSAGTNAPWIIARLPGVSSAAPMPWSIRAAISTSGVGRQPAQHRGDREPHDADDEHPPTAEPVAEGTAEQDQRARLSR